MRDLSLHLLDILDNCIAARATRVEVSVREDSAADLLELEVSDDGQGMDAEALRRARDPFYTTKPGKRVGLGLALLAQAAREAEGRMEIESSPRTGTRVRATFRLGHPDRKPLGDIAGTIDAVRASHPDIDVRYVHTTADRAIRQGGSR